MNTPLNKRIEVTGLPGTNIKRVINVLKTAFPNIEVEESKVFEEAILMPVDDITEESINELIVQKMDNNTYYVILDDIPGNCQRELQKNNIDIAEDCYSVETLTKLEINYSAIFRICKILDVNNITFITKIIPNYMEELIYRIKKYMKDKK